MLASGALSTLLGLFGLAKVMDYVPKDVLSAFTTGAAFNIMFTQLGSLFKITVATSHAPIVMFKNALVALPTLQPFTACISAAAITMLLALKRLPLHDRLKMPASASSILGNPGHRHDGHLQCAQRLLRLGRAWPRRVGLVPRTTGTSLAPRRLTEATTRTSPCSPL